MATSSKVADSDICPNVASGAPIIRNIGSVLWLPKPSTNDQQTLPVQSRARGRTLPDRSWTIVSELNGYGTTFPLRFDRGICYVHL